MYFDTHVRAEHLEKLQESLQELLEPSFNTQLRLLAAEQLAGFDKDLTVAVVEQPHGFSAAAEQAAAAALQGFDTRSQEYMVNGTQLTGRPGPARSDCCQQLRAERVFCCCHTHVLSVSVRTSAFGSSSSETGGL
jgi:hypothetical protein